MQGFLGWRGWSCPECVVPSKGETCSFPAQVTLLVTVEQCCPLSKHLLELLTFTISIGAASHGGLPSSGHGAQQVKSGAEGPELSTVNRLHLRTGGSMSQTLVDNT